MRALLTPGIRPTLTRYPRRLSKINGYYCLCGGGDKSPVYTVDFIAHSETGLRSIRTESPLVWNDAAQQKSTPVARLDSIAPTRMVTSLLQELLPTINIYDAARS
jgi:hypothetical protein